MRMLFTCRPATGHILPMLPLAEAARTAGHEVTFATATEVFPSLVARGFATAAAGTGPDPAIRAALTGADAPPLEKHRLIAFTRGFAGSEMEPRLRDLEPLIADHRPDVVVHEVAELAAPLAAATAGIPLVTMGFGPLLDPSVADAIAKVTSPLWRSRGLDPVRWAGLYRDLYIDPCPPALQVPEIDELSAVQRMRTQDGKPGPAPDWMINVKAPLTYITFGTIFNKNTEAFRRSIEALQTLQVELLVTLGDGLDPATLGPLPMGVRIARFIPQHTILGHCRLVVSHGGAGTTLGALAFGVPLLLLPQGADQLFNAQRCCAAGVALMLMPEEATVDAIARSAGRLLSEPSFAERAGALAAETAAMPGPPEAVSRIERLVA